MSITYGLRSEYQSTYVGGVLAVGDDSLNVREELETNDGSITIDDTDTLRMSVLDEYPALERIDGPEEGLPVGYVAEAPSGLMADISMADLRARAKTLGIESPGRSRDEVLTAIADAESDTTQES